MGQEAYAMFPALAEMQARSQLMRAQAGAVGQDARFAQQKYGDDRAAMTAFGNTDWSSPVPGGQPSPGGPAPMPPQPGQASQPMYPSIRVPQAGAPADAPPEPGLSSRMVDGRDQVMGPGSAGAPARPAVPPPTASPAPPVRQPVEGAHKWTPGPGEQYDTPDGSRPRSLAEVFAALKKANPKADPATLARAAAMYMPWLQEADQVELKRTISENTLELGKSRLDVQQQIADQGNKLKEQLAADKNELTERLAGDRIAAAQKRVDTVNQRMKDIAAGTLKLGQDKLEEARKSGDGRAALAAQKELRLQQEGITRLNDTYGRMIYNASFLKGEAKAAAMEEAAQFLESGMEAFRNLPDPTAEEVPTEPGSPDSRVKQGQSNFARPGYKQPQTIEELNKAMGGGKQSSLMEYNTKRRRVGLPARASIA